jgi:hypothetical protein
VLDRWHRETRDIHERMKPCTWQLLGCPIVVTTTIPLLIGYSECTYCHVWRDTRWFFNSNKIVPTHVPSQTAVYSWWCAVLFIWFTCGKHDRQAWYTIRSSDRRSHMLLPPINRTTTGDMFHLQPKLSYFSVTWQTERHSTMGSKGLKSAIICVFMLGFVLEQVQVEGKVCCPSPITTDCYNLCRVGLFRKDCARLCRCKIVTEDTCPPVGHPTFNFVPNHCKFNLFIPLFFTCLSIRQIHL